MKPNQETNYFYVEQRNRMRTYADAPEISFTSKTGLLKIGQANSIFASLLQYTHGTKRIVLFETAQT
jgi:hypothetical protein